MQLGLVLICLSFPLLELAVMIKVGQWIGVGWTLFLLATAILAGGIIIRIQGFAALRRMLEAMREGKPPLEAVVDGAFLMLAGGLLLLPGFISDIAGLLLLVPPLRRWVAGRLWRRMLRSGTVHMETRTYETRRGPPPAEQPETTFPPRPGEKPRNNGVVIEGEWERVDEPPGPGKHSSLPRDKR